MCVAFSLAIMSPLHFAKEGEATPRFVVEFPKTAHHADTRRIKVSEDKGSVVFDVTDKFGIGSGKVKLRAGSSWPKKVLIRMHLSGLEGFSVTVKKRILLKGELNLKMLDSKGNPVKGRYLLQFTGPNSSKKIAGYYEAEVPQRLLGGAKEIELSWVDFYRR